MVIFWAISDFLLAEDSGPDEPITQPTNRGNKLRANAKYVREGALGYIHPEQFYKQVTMPTYRALVFGIWTMPRGATKTERLMWVLEN
jgi:hypothetical protein